LSEHGAVKKQYQPAESGIMEPWSEERSPEHGTRNDMITRVGLIGVWVSDQNAALAFYCGKLGFEKVSDTGSDEEFRWVEVAPKGAQTGITLVKPFPGMQHAFGRSPEELIGTSSLIFDTDDISATYRDLTKKGVVFTEEPTMQPWGRLQAQFVDQDGNNFVLVERTNLRS
jgi:catechol 2,3-dioxygenase-like lactoylglutathione lyase family enzyme